jgi:hypothetical protein
MTQRALALDEGAARAALERAAQDAGTKRAEPAVLADPARRTVRSAWDALFVVLTLGLGWLWLRRRGASAAGAPARGAAARRVIEC